MKKNVTCLIPSATGTEHILGSLFCVVNQTNSPFRIILGDSSEDGVENLFAVRRFCRVARIEVIRLDSGTNAHDTRKKLVESVTENCEFVWFVDDDVWPTFNCLSILLKTQKKFSANGVVGLKKEVTRPNPFGGKDWNASGDSIRRQQVSWCDTANLLLEKKSALDGIYNADIYMKKDNKITGEDVLAFAPIACNGLCLSEPEAVAYHIPLTKERWKDLDGSDKVVLDTLSDDLPSKHIDWMKRVLDQSNW